MVYCDCDSEDDEKFPALSFLVGNELRHWFLLSGRDYLMFSQQHQRCALLVRDELSSTSQLWLMGDPFLRAYYSIYDMENKRIGLVGVARTTKEGYNFAPKEVNDDGKRGTLDAAAATVKDTVRETEAAIEAQLGLDEDSEWIAPLLISLAGCIYTCAICCLFNWWLKHRRNNEHSKELKA